jgi:dTDP-4-dehydrorhamnose reductase
VKIAVIGARGQLGRDLVLACEVANVECVRLNRPEIDVYWRVEALQFALRDLSPDDVVVNTANDLWAAEAEVLDMPNVRERISKPVIGLADACLWRDLRLVQISSDYIFGREPGPHSANSHPMPICKYGHAKVQAEAFARKESYRHPMVVRLGCLYGPLKIGGTRLNFVERMARAARDGIQIDVVDDVFMSPTYTLSAAKAIVAALLDGSSHRIFHACSRNSASYFDVAKFVFNALNSKGEVRPKKCDEPWRPRNTAMKPSYRAAIWEDEVIEYLQRFGWLATDYAFAAGSANRLSNPAAN